MRTNSSQKCFTKEFIQLTPFSHVIREYSMVQKSRKNISIYDDTYETLRHMGSVTESFDSVVRKLIEKAASVKEESPAV